MAALLLAAAIAAATQSLAPAAAPTEASSEPAIFMVRDADTTIYIFGTFHVLDARTTWFKDRIRDAFERSDELVLETLVPEPRPAEAAGIPQPQGLRSLTITSSASFLATTRLAISAGRRHGMQVDNGADMVLRRSAEAEGKRVEGLETLQSQLTMFTRIPSSSASPGSPAITSPDSNSRAMDSLSQSMAEMQSAWGHGDQTLFVRMLGQLEHGAPETYRMMFIERNARWADWIRARLQTPGTVFVAVGSGHLAGKDSLLVQLAQRGLASKRIY